jgi:hypothetical protein
MLKKLGLVYNVINVCKNICTLFKGIHARVESCPHNQKPRFKVVGKSKVAKNNMLLHFPLGLQLQQIYNILAQA